jgi:Obg family GTPase CgtA-like protein
MGVERLLDEAGATAGDEVRIGDIQFEYEPEGVSDSGSP